MISGVIVDIDQAFFGIAKQRVLFVVGRIRLSAGRQICPRRHGDNSAGHRHVMILKIHTQCHGESTTC